MFGYLSGYWVCDKIFNDEKSSSLLTLCVDRMDEEIVVDDIDETGTAAAQQVDDSTVMPLLYIQQNKVRSTQSQNVNQTLVSPSTQLAAIINPVNNQVILFTV